MGGARADKHKILSCKGGRHGRMPGNNRGINCTRGLTVGIIVKDMIKVDK